MQQKKQFLSSTPSILAICLLKLKKSGETMPLIIFCKLPKGKSKLPKTFLRFPHINRTVSDRETYISALKNLRFRNGRHRK